MRPVMYLLTDRIANPRPNRAARIPTTTVKDDPIKEETSAVREEKTLDALATSNIVVCSFPFFCYQTTRRAYALASRPRYDPPRYAYIIPLNVSVFKKQCPHETEKERKRHKHYHEVQKVVRVHATSLRNSRNE